MTLYTSSLSQYIAYLARKSLQQTEEISGAVVADEAILIVQPAYVARNVQLRSYLSDVSLWGERVLLREALINLLHNALEFSPENTEVPAIQPYRRFSEPFRRWVYQHHHAGIDAATLAAQEGLGQATVSRCYAQFTERRATERLSLQCPQVLGLDEHTLHKHHRFATTFCDLKNHRVFDVVPGRSSWELEPYMKQLKGREQVKVVCIDLSSSYRALIRRYFPCAKIVADRFHVVRLVYAHFMEMIRAIAPQINWHRGHLACLRRPPSRLSPEQWVRRQQFIEQHPALEPLLHLRDQLCTLLNLKTQTKRQCRSHVRALLQLIARLQTSQLTALQTLAHTLSQWSGPIAAMWRFSKNNGITEGFHRKMKLIQRRAYGFRNFNNYRLRVIAHCG